MPISKSLSREKKTLLIISLLFFGIVILTFLETWLQGAELTTKFITNNILVFAVVNINIILLMVLMLLVLRNLIKLYFEHRQKAPGAKFKTRLIVAFSALSVIPALILFIVSLIFINRSIHTWFETRIEETLKGSTELTKAFYQNAGQGNLYFARRLGGLVSSRRLLSSGTPERLLALISDRRKEYNLSQITVFDPEGRELVAVADPETPSSPVSRSAQKAVRQALKGEEVTLIEPLGKGDVVRSLVPVTSAGDRRSIEGVLAVGTFIPESLGQKVDGITSTYENYRQSKILKNPIRVSYQMTLGMIFMLITFFATWFAFYLARFITVPIQKMAEGTRRISDGDLDFKIESESGDELGMLIDSFNRMTGDLRANKIKLEAAYRRLERGNLELEGRKLYIETVLDNIATGVISLDPKGRLTTVNKAAQSMLELKPEECAGRSYREALGSPAYAELKAFVDDLFSRDLDRMERRMDLAAGGSRLNLILTGSNLYDDRGAYSGTVIVLENLTELISAQRLAAWREVARRIAHEIKNPLTPIRLSAQRLRKKFFQRSDDFDRVFDEGTQMIVSQVDELKKLVDEFSRFARMPSSRPAPTDIHSLLASTVKFYAETYKDMTFVTDFHPEPLMAMVDAEQMKRAFVNLIDNGMEATGGRGTIRVETAFDRNTHNIRISFRDDGRGIPADLRDRLFTPYFSTKKEGTGLGLTIVSSIVSEHNGYIRVKSNSPRGTVFVIELPALKGDRINA